MSPNEQAAYNAGIESMRRMAMIAAVTIEARDDARKLRQCAAAADLQGLAEGAKALLLEAATAKDLCLDAVQNNSSPLVADGQDEP